MNLPSVSVRRLILSVASLALMLLAGARPTVAQGPRSSAPPQAAPIARAHSAARLSGVAAPFVANLAASPNGIRFQMRGADRALSLSDDALWFTLLEKPSAPSAVPALRGGALALAPLSPGSLIPQTQPSRGVNLKFSFVGANPQPRLEPFDPLPGHVSYFIGNDPDKWQSGLPTWGGVRYVDLYPGVDLELQQAGGPIAQRFIVHDGADLSAVRLRVEGADGLDLDQGTLHLHTALGEFRWTLPALITADASPWLGVSGGAQVAGDEVIAPYTIASAPSPTAVTGMNPSQPSATTINVVFIPGVDCNSYACKLVLDTSGAAYVTGYITSATLPVTPGAFDTTFNGGAWSGDSFVVKLAASGAIIYATYLGGTNDDWGYAIAVDSSGAAYVTGSTGSSDFPTTAGAFHTVCGNGLTCGQEDAFVTKFDPTGSSLVYSTFLGGDGFEWGSKIAVDSSGAVYIMGLTGSPDFPTTPGAYQTTMNGMSDLFVTKLNAAGSALVYSTYIGSAVVSGCNPELVSGGALDQSGAVYVVGSAPSTFPTTPGAFQTVHGGCSDGIVFKLSADGSALLYSTFLGGSDVDDVYGITIDLSGAIYVSGDSCSSDFPTTPGAYQTTQSNCDAVVAKLDPTLSTLLYSTYIGGSQLDGGLDIVTDASGAAYVSGSMIFVTTTVDFPITPDAVQPVPGGGNYDAFVLVLSPGGNGLNDLLYSTYLGGSGDEHGWSIALDASGGIHVAGGTTSSDFPHSARPTQIRATATVTPTGYVATFAAPTVAQDIANGVSYNGWHGVGDLHASGGAYRVSKVAKDSATFKFSGTSITWVTRKGPDQGKAQVTIDGVNKGTLDLYSPTVQWNVQQSFGGLTNASHTLVVKVAGTKNPGSTDFNVALDAFIVGSTTTQESALAVQYDSWTGVSDTRAFGGSYRTSKTASATASWTFSGTQVDWITALGPSYGQAKVFLDGVDQGTIDLYAATQQWKAVKAFTTGAGTHTIQVQVLGTKNPLSRGTQVLVDSFQSFP